MAATISPNNPVGSTWLKKAGIAYSPASGIASSPMNNEAISGVLFVKNVYAAIPQNMGIKKRIVNEIAETVYCCLTAFGDSMAKARETAVGHTAQPTMPAANNWNST